MFQSRAAARRVQTLRSCKRPSLSRPVLNNREITTYPRRSSAVATAHASGSSIYTDDAQHLHPDDLHTDDLPITSQDANQVAVGWDTRTWSRFHNIWLRDHCRCPKCFHPITKQRLFNTFEIPKDLTPLHVDAKPGGLQVTWPSKEPHVSVYPWSWLQLNSYDPPLNRKQESNEKILWGSKIQQSPPTVAYEEVMNDNNHGLYKWLTNVHKFGFSFVSGVPATTEATEELALRIGFIRETQYGKFWDFTSDLAKGDTAYTTLALGAHTDNTYFTDPCGLQLFHLLSHTHGTGGATLLVDGFYAASLMRELHPSAYRLLSEVPVPAHAAGDAGSLYATGEGYPVLTHTGQGELVQVRWNNDDRSVMRGLSADVVEEWYEAIRLWNKCLTSPDSEYWVQLQPGTAVVVDNHRVLHGRSAFTGKRRMCGAYIGVDEYKSKLAVLREQFSNSSTGQGDGLEEQGGKSSGEKERDVWHPLL
ncbi:Trimethyllysine dioxygenase [Psilocybe cubensis]|uniref:trimethyllysine dioxygenase n=2 Tax=Psilocybe cubensis TaxID=181762 RepID=A0A8H8CMY0_PSICU|nr:Trimethyllysine dioxygenase [Psilocybe cubensis]KAH9481695.1 Trimethyllysine dioxygenase [Psilocybe cubensis]